jgi:hypothetical protein
VWWNGRSDLIQAHVQRIGSLTVTERLFLIAGMGRTTPWLRGLKSSLGSPELFCITTFW